MSYASPIWRQAGEHRRMPWKNGQGETLEVARSPDGQSLDAFDWRVSVAPVIADGAFSLFPAIERTIAVVEGDGMDLALADGRQHRLRPGIPFTYDGGMAVHGRLIRGPVRDFNVMSRRGKFTGDLVLSDGPLAWSGGMATIVAYALLGAWMVTVGDTDGRLETGSSLTATANTLRLSPVAAGSRVAIAVLRRYPDLTPPEQ
ncbi:MAG: HutD family protein [Hyphomicrobiaceae bacterium]